MRRRSRLHLWLALVGVLLLLPTHPLWAAGGARYFPETGHTVEGSFLDYYRAQPDATLLMGYPITEAIHRNGVTIQYFQRVVLQQGEKDFAPTTLNLGSVFYAHPPEGLQREPLPLTTWGTTGCQTFVGEDNSTHPVCYEFLRFYERYKAYLGLVVSDPLMENGIPVQYFQGARLEYDPARGQVTLSNLGEWYFQRFEPNQALRLPVVPGSNAPNVAVLTVDVRLAVSKILTLPGESQTVFVQVTDHLGRPLPNAHLAIDLLTPSGDSLASVLATLPREMVTDDQGCAQLTFTTPAHYRGRVTVKIVASFAGRMGESETTFRVWH